MNTPHMSAPPDYEIAIARDTKNLSIASSSPAPAVLDRKLAAQYGVAGSNEAPRPTAKVDRSIKRKPVGPSETDPLPANGVHQTAEGLSQAQQHQAIEYRSHGEAPTPLRIEPNAPPQQVFDDFETESPTALSHTSTEASLMHAPTGTSVTSNQSTSGDKSKLKSFYEDARHFAGGLVAHPYESNRRFAILRHSHGIVYFNGPSTSVAITIFADKPLPSDRSIFLQRKGWTGQRGMKFRSAVGINSTWINVTPDRIVKADTINPTDERAWQRDIEKFNKKKPKDLSKHVVRETNVVRIPHDATDGYFRLVLCAGDSKKVLCPSPVFRVASTSTSAASIKGASLSTLPLELGISIGSLVANNQFATWAAPVTQSAAATYQAVAPSWTTTAQTVAPIAYDLSGASGKLDSANEAYEQARADQFANRLTDGAEAISSTLERTRNLVAQAGPSPPFPLQFDSRIVRGSGRSAVELGMPTANLARMPPDFHNRLAGVYFGWAKISAASDKQAQANGTAELLADDEWKPAILTVAPSPYAVASVAPQKIARAYLLHDYPIATSFVDHRIRVSVLGFLRPCDHNVPSAEQIYEDVSCVQDILSSPGWDIEGLEREDNQGLEKKKSLTDRYVAARQFSQNQIDRVPIHRLGVRMDSGAAKDREFDRGGLCILR